MIGTALEAAVARALAYSGMILPRVSAHNGRINTPKYLLHLPVDRGNRRTL